MGVLEFPSSYILPIAGFIIIAFNIPKSSINSSFIFLPRLELNTAFIIYYLLFLIKKRFLSVYYTQKKIIHQVVFSLQLNAHPFTYTNSNNF